MECLANVECNKEISANPFYIENWKLKTFSKIKTFYQLAKFSQEFKIKLPMIVHQTIFHHITKIKLLQDLMKHHGFDSIQQVPSNSYRDPIPLLSITATKMIEQARHTTKIPFSQSEAPVLLGQRICI